AGIVKMESSYTGYQSNLTVISGTLTNLGTIEVNAGTGGPRTIDAELDNQGTLDINTQTTLTGENVANQDIIDIASGRTLSVSSSTFENAANGTIQGTGTLNVTNTTFTNSGTIDPGINVIN
ncbi:MAG: hypothetical protein K0U66_03185, partial [Gammaproteobacteria bacterium]|nr:hypothetical protein [Gammaproteobacteria bacterium]